MSSEKHNNAPVANLYEDDFRRLKFNSGSANEWVVNYLFYFQETVYYNLTSIKLQYLLAGSFIINKE